MSGRALAFSLLIVGNVSVGLCQNFVPAYLGFDRNTYPGDTNLKNLHETFLLHRLLAQQSSAAKKSTHGPATAPPSNPLALDFSCSLTDASMPNSNRPDRNPLPTRQSSATPTRKPPPLPRVAKAFPRTPSSSSIKSKADACCPSRRPTFTRGSTAVTAAGFGAGIYCSGIAAIR